MKSSLRTRSTRALAAGAISVALLTAGTAGAFAAPKPTPSPKLPTSPMSTKPGLAPKTTQHKPAAVASITIKADKTDVKVGQAVTFAGRAPGNKIGATLVLQRFNGKKWVPAKTTTVKKGSVYAVTVKPANKGALKYRVSHGKTHSSEVMVTVK
ncbi:hypothetical protein ABT173_22885 [Streptomyces sp. NPDC001795]|uniref:hypothetical protein n=1 Tax=unclassified Streptomyces TaxID=2593676 RepID=UPI00331C8B83